MFDSVALRAAMQAAGTGPTELARLAGVSRSAVWTAMSGRRVPGYAVAKRLAAALSIEPSRLWGPSLEGAP